MNEILGLFVLASPFSLVILIMVLSIIVALIFSKKLFGKMRRIIGGAAIVVLMYFGLTGQEMIGSTYHEYLCENKTEQNFYGKIILPDGFWNKDGSLNVETENGELDFKELGKLYIVETFEELYIDSIMTIKKIKYIYFNPATKQKIAERTTFLRLYGWSNMFSLSPSIGESCNTVLIKKYGERNYYDNYNLKIKIFFNNLFTK